MYFPGPYNGEYYLYTLIADPMVTKPKMLDYVEYQT